MILVAVVLIFTNSRDGEHTDVVARKIIQKGSTVVRFDTDEISRGNHKFVYRPEGVAVLTVGDAEYNLLDVTSAWLRRPYVFDFDVRNSVQKAHTENEFQALLAGLCALLGDKRWLNTPHAMERARLKVYQLRLAKDLGFLVPDSVITADPEVARRFCAEGRAVFKPLIEPNIVGDNGKTLLIPTTLLTDRHLAKLDLIRNQYVLLQRYVRKQYELRITYVNGELFVAKQIPQDRQKAAAMADWRPLQINGRSTYESAHLPDELADKIKRLMRTLDLNFAALDFAVDYHGNHYFLEVNPNGQWFGYTDEIGMPASSAIAQFLVESTVEGGETK